MPNLLLRNVEVVEQPLVRGCDGVLLADSLLDALIRVEEHPAVVLQTFDEVSAAFRTGGDVLRSREAFSMLFETLDAEELAANQLFRVRLEHGNWSPECPRN